MILKDNEFVAGDPVMMDSHSPGMSGVSVYGQEKTPE